MSVFSGYKRSNGSVGIRNRVFIVSSVSCVNETVDIIASAVPGTIPIKHAYGCDASRSAYYPDTLTHLCMNPNCYAAVLIGLGCPGTEVEGISKVLETEGIKTFAAVIQRDGGSLQVIERAIAAASKFQEEAQMQQRTNCEMDRLYIGLTCEGNVHIRKMGIIADICVSQGYSVLLSMPSLVQIQPVIDRGWKHIEYAERLESNDRRVVQVCGGCLEDKLTGLFASGAQLYLDMENKTYYRYLGGPIVHLNLDDQESILQLPKRLRDVTASSADDELKFVNHVMHLPVR